MTVIISIVVLEDIEQILAIEQASFGEEAFSEEFFRWLILSRGDLFLVARQGRAIIGYAVSALSHSEGYIESIAVSAEDRRQGVGLLLLNTLIKRLVDRGGWSLTLHVDTINLAAITFYKNQGFSIEHIRPNYYPDNRSAYFMRRSLSTG